MLIHSESPERLIAGAFNDGCFNLGCDEKISKSFPAIRPTSKQNSRVISIKDNKPFYYFPRGGNIKFLAPAVVSVIFTESKIFSLQVLPIGRAVPTSAVPLGCQTLPVSSVREEVRPQRPPVQTHQSAPLPADQPDGSRRKLSRRRGPLGISASHETLPSLAPGPGPWERDVNVQALTPSASRLEYVGGSTPCLVVIVH